MINAVTGVASGEFSNNVMLIYLHCNTSLDTKMQRLFVFIDYIDDYCREAVTTKAFSNQRQVSHHFERATGSLI